MEQVFTEAIKQSPMLALVLVLVWIFLQHVREMMASHGKRTDEFISTVKEINAEQKSSRDQHTAILSSLVNEVTRLSERLTNQHERRH